MISGEYEKFFWVNYLNAWKLRKMYLTILLHLALEEMHKPFVVCIY